MFMADWFTDYAENAVLCSFLDYSACAATSYFLSEYFLLVCGYALAMQKGGRSLL